MQARGSMGWLVVLVVAVPGGLATVDLGDIDMEAIVERLISPVGMVNQFALQAETNAIGTAGWLGLGLLWRVVTPLLPAGPIFNTVNSLSYLFDTQELALTIIRGIFNTARDLASRLVITFFVYGLDETMAGLADVSVQSVKDFLNSQDLLFLVTGRAIAQFVIFMAVIPFLFGFALYIYPSLRPSLPARRSLLAAHLSDPWSAAPALPPALTEGVEAIVSSIVV